MVLGGGHRAAPGPKTAKAKGRSGQPAISADTQALLDGMIWNGNHKHISSLSLYVYAGEAHRKLCAQSCKANDWVN